MTAGGGPSASEATSGTASPTRESRVRVLIVDDDPSKRLALVAALEPLGHDLVEADSGTAALRCVLAHDFAVILLDVRMPDMSGFETAALIRQRRQSETTPIIFITSYRSDEIPVADRYSGGAVDFMFAPVPAAELRSKVAVFANLFLKAEHLAAHARAWQASADQLTLLTDAAPVGIFQTDRKNRYVYTNPLWSTLTGLAPEEAIGHPWETIVSLDQRADLRAALNGLGEVSTRFELRAAGSTAARTVSITTKMIPDGVGGLAGWVGTLADVTAVVEAEVAMAAARDAAVTATAMEYEFAASVSHELRTPTTSILGYVEEVLEGDGLSHQDRRFLEVVLRNAHRLSTLIDDLLLVGQAEIGTAMMHIEPMAVPPLVERVGATFLEAAQRAGISLFIDSEPALRDVRADRQRLEQSLANLISNALKFTPRGGRVTVRTRGDDETIAIAVSDTGMGIEPADLDRIFGRFYRTKGAVDAAIKGTGLGLAIAKGMIEAQGGHLDVTSTAGRGSTFTLTLPIGARALQAA